MRTPVLILIALAIVGPCPSLAAQESVRAWVELEDRPHFVGEPFDLAVGAMSRDEEPRIVLPRLAHARIAIIDRFMQPVQVTTIGKMVLRQNVHAVKCRVVCDQAGTLEIPPIEIRVGNRVGRTRASRVTILAPPGAGRPGHFLGGIGEFELDEEVDPPVARVGDWVLVRIFVDGPAALGMSPQLNLTRWQGLPRRLEIRQGQSSFELEPPSRTYEIKVRPLDAGDVTLPPILIAAYDPKLRSYQTHPTRALMFKAVAVPRLDIEAIEPQEAKPASSTPVAGWGVALAAGLAALLGATAFAAMAGLRKKTRGPDAAQRYAARVGRGPGLGRERDVDTPALARRINNHMIRYLEIGVGRPPGALTPAETRAGVMELTTSAALADEAGKLAESCDERLYGAGAESRDQAALEQEARHLFERLGRSTHGRARSRLITPGRAEAAD